MTFKRDNQISMVLFVIGIIIIFLGFIIGLSLGYELGHRFWSITFTWWTVGFISGMTFIGFSEIIELLHQSNSLKRKELVSLNIFDDTPPSSEPNEIRSEIVEHRLPWQLAKNDEVMVYEFYVKKKMEVERIINTPFEDLCLVKVNGDFELVEVGSFKPALKDINKLPKVQKWFEENKHEL